MSMLAIKGHATRGKEVIEILEKLGGMVKGKTLGTETFCAYYIDSDGSIDYKHYSRFDDATQFTLEEFLEKFPYKVGNRIKIPNCDVACRVTNMIWNGIEIEYETTNSEETFFADDLQPYKEETMNKAVFDASAQCCDIMNHLIKEKAMEIKMDIPKGYEFAGVDDDNQQVVFTKIQPQYPKTYEECCDILNRTPPINDDVEGYKWKLLMNYQRLLVARDAYWKIVGEQMGLGKSWEPDYTNDDAKFCICCCENLLADGITYDANQVLVFPTAEMRAEFRENFKGLLEQCKELL